MEQYFLLSVTAMLCAIGCHGQLVTDLSTEQLHARVRQLDETVLQLLTKIEEMQTSKSALPNNALQNTEKRGYPMPYYQADGFTLQGGEVGFSVTLAQDKQLTFGSKIMFDTIGENIGNAYSKATGEFVCPVSGTYMFAVNIACKKGSYIEASVAVYSGNTDYILNVKCDHLKRPSADGRGLYCGETQNGGTAIAQLKQGERVFVKKVWPDDVSVVVGKGLTSFSGYLLRPS